MVTKVGEHGQDGRAVQGAAFRSQSGLPGVGSNPTPDTSCFVKFFQYYIMTKILIPLGFEPRTSRVLGERDNHYTMESHTGWGLLFLPSCECYHRLASHKSVVDQLHVQLLQYHEEKKLIFHADPLCCEARLAQSVEHQTFKA